MIFFEETLSPIIRQKWDQVKGLLEPEGDLTGPWGKPQADHFGESHPGNQSDPVRPGHLTTKQPTMRRLADALLWLADSRRPY
jgi:hypothetical protein